MGKRIRQKQCEFGVSLYSGTLAIPTLTLAGSGFITMTVAPVSSNADALAAGDVLSFNAVAADLPGGFVITNVRATGAASVRVQYTTLLAVSTMSLVLSVVKLRG